MEKQISEHYQITPKISCIVPVYNVEKYLHCCIDSILSQTFTDFELILVDDGSPDNSPAICDEYARKDNRIKVIHQKNAGVSVARNSGMDIMQGDYYCFIDSDDWITTDYLEKLYNTAKEENADLVVCGYNWQTKDGSWKLMSPDEIKEKKVFTRESFFCAFPKMRVACKAFMALQSPWMRLYRQVSKSHPRFDPSVKYGEDYLFNLEFYNSDFKKIVYIPDCLYQYRWTVGSAGKQISEKRIHDEIYIINRTEDFFMTYCSEKSIKYFYQYKKQQMAMLVNSLFIAEEKGIEKNILSRLKQIRKQISVKILFYNFFKLKQTVTLFLLIMNLTGGGRLLAKIYLQSKRI